jgi:hypothetical protein
LPNLQFFPPIHEVIMVHDDVITEGFLNGLFKIQNQLISLKGLSSNVILAVQREGSEEEEIHRSPGGCRDIFL